MLINKDAGTKLEIPHEPGEWVVIRPVPWGFFEEVENESTIVKKTLKIFIGSLVSWSYDAEINEENLEWLDTTTAEWLNEQIDKINRQDKKRSEQPDNETST